MGGRHKSMYYEGVLLKNKASFSANAALDARTTFPEVHGSVVGFQMSFPRKFLDASSLHVRQSSFESD